VTSVFPEKDGNYGFPNSARKECSGSTGERRRQRESGRVGTEVDEESAVDWHAILSMKLGRLRN
jgi:hypothetical protein